MLLPMHVHFPISCALNSLLVIKHILVHTSQYDVVSRSHTLSKTGEGLVCLASTTHARGMLGMFGLRNILYNKLRLLTCYTKYDVTAPALTKFNTCTSIIQVYIL